MKRVLIVGGDGLIGAHLCALMPKYGWQVVPTTRRKNIHKNPVRLDLNDFNIDSIILPRVDLAILAAAITTNLRCEADPTLAYNVNVAAPLKLARRLAAEGIRSIFLSTNAVFDGSKPFARAVDAVRPLTAYGRMKSEAEKGFFALGRYGCVVRLTKVIESTRPLINKWIEELKSNRSASAFGDLTMAPISLEDVVRAVLTISESGDLLHVSGSEDISYYNALSFIANKVGPFDPRMIREGSVTETGLPASQFPKYSSLDSSNFRNLCDWQPPKPYSLLNRMLDAD